MHVRETVPTPLMFWRLTFKSTYFKMNHYIWEHNYEFQMDSRYEELYRVTYLHNKLQRVNNFFYAAPSPPNRSTMWILSCLSTFSPNSVDRGNKKSSTTRSCIYFFPPTLEKREKEVSRCGWYTLFILGRVHAQTKEQENIWASRNLLIGRDWSYTCVQKSSQALLIKKSLCYRDHRIQEELYKNVGNPVKYNYCYSIFCCVEQLKSLSLHFASNIPHPFSLETDNFLMY